MVEYPHSETPPAPAPKPKRQRFGRAQKAALIIIGIPLVITTPAWLWLGAMNADQWIGLTSTLVEWGITVTVGGGAILEMVRSAADAYRTRRAP